VTIHILRERATANQLNDMLQVYATLIKLAVDTERQLVAGGGEWHADCEAELLRDGSHQENIWGADWLPNTKQVKFEGHDLRFGHFALEHCPR
jgi:Protein of unknown function (DUF5674)